MSIKFCNLCNENKDILAFELGRNQCKKCLRDHAKERAEKQRTKKYSKPNQNVHWCADHKKWLPIACFNVSSKNANKLSALCTNCQTRRNTATELKKSAKIELPEKYEKQCNTCKITKMINNFTKLEQNLDKHHNTCKECLSDQAKKRSVHYTTPSGTYLKICPKPDCAHQGKPIIAKNNFRHNQLRKDTYYDWCKTCEKADSQTLRGVVRRKRAMRNYQQSETGKQTRKQEYIRNRDHYAARHAVNHAVEGGILPPAKNLNCFYCAVLNIKTSAVSFHHTSGYSKEHKYDVVPACQHHHVKRDMEIANNRN